MDHGARSLAGDPDRGAAAGAERTPARHARGGLRELLARGAGAVGVRRAPPPGGSSGEVNAATCLEMFLCATLGRRGPSASSLATALFALGALDAAADRAALDRGARQRLEAKFLRAFYGTGGRQTEAWRRALHAFERTREGWAIRLRGEAALRAWLRGEPPSPYLARVLAS